MLKYQDITHRRWEQDKGPARDRCDAVLPICTTSLSACSLLHCLTKRARFALPRGRYNMGENPQYAIEVNSDGKCQVWVLLSRHIVDIEDFANNREFITCHIFRGGNRIHHPDNPVVLGTKINSPHYLARFEHPGGAASYTVVISQHEKSSSLTFTLKVLSNAPFKFSKVPDLYVSPPPPFF